MAINESEWNPVTSSNVDAVSFLADDPEEAQLPFGRGVLMIRYRDGSIYAYPNQQRSLFSSFLTTGSPGRLRWRALPDTVEYRRVN